MNEMALGTRYGLGTYFCVQRGEEENRPQIALASKNFAPLICRVVRAMRAVRWRWALGLDFWGGASASLRFSPPTSEERRFRH